MIQFKPEFKATGIGSLPQKDPDKAVGLVMDHLPQVPFWPQLSNRTPWEDMVVQCTPGQPYIEVVPGDEPNTLKCVFNPNLELPTGAEVTAGAEQVEYLERFALKPEIAAGFSTFMNRLNEESVGIELLKGQVTGPLTFGLSVKEADGKAVIYQDDLADIYAEGLGMKGAWQIQAFSEAGYPGLIFVDEPSFQTLGSAFLSIDSKRAVELLNLTIKPIKQAGGLAGIHICGNSDWEAVLSSDINMVNFDSYKEGEAFVGSHRAIQVFLDQGGMIAWGIVPTVDYHEGLTPDDIIGKLSTLIDSLVRYGVNRALLEERSMITPACGLGGLSVTTAEKILSLLAKCSQILRGDNLE